MSKDRELRMETTIQLSAWYREIEAEIIKSYVQELLDEHHSVSHRPDKHRLSYWDFVNYKGKSVFCSLVPQTENHLCFELMCRGKPRELLPTFISLFRKIVVQKYPSVNECIIADTNADVYPWFTHSFYKGAAPLVIHEVDGDAEQIHTSADEDYWDVAGHALHFVGHHLFAVANMPTPAQWSSTIQAATTVMDNGVMFDCGWVRTWPDYTIS